MTYLCFNIDSKVLLFADDTTFFSGNSDPVSVQLAVNKLFCIAYDWFASNKLALSFNNSKTQAIDFILNSDLVFPNTVKLLGFTLDSTLTQHEHVKLVPMY